MKHSQDDVIKAAAAIKAGMSFRKAEKELPVTTPPPSYHLEFALLSQSNYNFQAYILWHFPLSFTCFDTGITFVWVRPIVWGVRF